MRLQSLFAGVLITLQTALALPISEINRQELDTEPFAQSPSHNNHLDSNPNLARDFTVPAEGTITIPPPAPLAVSTSIPAINNPQPAAPTLGAPAQFSFAPNPTAAPGSPGTTTLSIISFPGVTVEPFTAAPSGPASFTGVATPLGSAPVINPVPETL